MQVQYRGAAFAAQNSCNLAKLNPPPPVTPSMAKVPLMYAIRSTDSVAGDHTAVAHSVFADGWMQQVFLAKIGRAHV